jgi:hypothetical protein
MPRIFFVFYAKNMPEVSSMNMKNGGGVPLGLGMALMQEPEAYKKFCSMSAEEQQAVKDKTHSIGSPQEMRAYVRSLRASD